MLFSETSLRVAASALLLALAACGGGVSIGLNIGNDRDLSSPSVSIAASASSVQAGQPLTLIAAASDPSGIDSVAFYRVDGNTTTLLGSDGSAPYEWPTVAPTDGRSTLSVFARATDNTGNRADSQVIAIAVTP